MVSSLRGIPGMAEPFLNAVWAFAFPILRQLLEPDLAVPPIFHGQPGAVVFEVLNGQHLPGPGAKPLIWVVPSDFIPPLEFAPPIVLA